MTDDDRIGRMSARNLTRTRKAVEAVESAVFGIPQSSGGGASVQFIVRAKVTTAIPTGTFEAPSSSGKAQIYRFNGTAWVASGDPVVVWNQNTGSTIPVGRAVMLAWIAGKWWLLTGSCG